MATTATARSTAPARSPRPDRPKRAPAPRRRRRGATPITGFVPVAAVRTVGAVGGIADSGIFVWLTRGRLWIGLLGALLVGIVGLNVMALSFSASSSTAGQQADDLRRANSALRTELAGKLSSEQVQAEAEKLGLIFAPPGSIRYLHTAPDDAVTAAERLRSGKLDPSTYVPPAAPVTEAPVVATDTAAVAPTEETVAPVETEVAVEPEVAPTETATTEAPVVAEAPVEPATSTPVDGGGVGAP